MKMANRFGGKLDVRFIFKEWKQIWIALCKMNILYILGYLILAIGVLSVFGVVCFIFPELPVAEMSGQVYWLSINGMVFGLCGLISYCLFIFSKSDKSPDLVLWLSGY